MSQKKYLRTSINFGKRGELSREIVEKIIKKKGNVGLSEEIRKALVTHFSNKPEFKEAKINSLIEERKKLHKELKNLSEKLSNNGDDLEKLGYEVDL